MNQPLYRLSFSLGKTSVPCQFHWFEPELTYHFLTLYVNVHRFVAIETVEEEPIWPCNPFNRWHEVSVWHSSQKSFEIAYESGCQLPNKRETGAVVRHLADGAWIAAYLQQSSWK